MEKRELLNRQRAAGGAPGHSGPVVRYRRIDQGCAKPAFGDGGGLAVTPSEPGGHRACLGYGARAFICDAAPVVNGLVRVI